MKRIFVFALLLCVFLNAQEKNRVEFDLRDDFEGERVSALGKHGLLVQSFGTKKSKGMKKLNNEFFSTDLLKEKEVKVDIPSKADFIASYYDENDYVNYSFLRSRRDLFVLVVTDAKDYSVRTVDVAYDDDASLSKMYATGGKVYFKSVNKKENFLISIDSNTGDVNEMTFKIDGFRRNDITLEDFQVFDDEILAFVNAKKNKRIENLYISELDKDGKQKDFYEVTKEIEEKLISVTATKLNDKLILTGTYGKKRKDMSNGMFFSSVSNKKLDYINFYNFADLKNFSSYMGDRKEKRIKRKQEKAKKRGKELLLNYNIALHPLKETNNGYIFLGEAFYPTYVSYMCGQNRWCTYFDGYQYTHAVIANFNKSGDLLWDDSFEMWADNRPFYVKRFISFENQENNLELIFGNNRNLVYKVVDANNGKVLEEETEELFDTGVSHDKVKRTNSSIEPWYDKYFVAYGFQKVKNSKVKRKKRVFFINKVKID